MWSRWFAFSDIVPFLSISNYIMYYTDFCIEHWECHSTGKGLKLHADRSRWGCWSRRGSSGKKSTCGMRMLNGSMVVVLFYLSVNPTAGIRSSVSLGSVLSTIRERSQRSDRLMNPTRHKRMDATWKITCWLQRFKPVKRVVREQIQSTMIPFSECGGGFLTLWRIRSFLF